MLLRDVAWLGKVSKLSLLSPYATFDYYERGSQSLREFGIIYEIYSSIMVKKYSKSIEKIGETNNPETQFVD